MTSEPKTMRTNAAGKSRRVVRQDTKIPPKNNWRKQSPRNGARGRDYNLPYLLARELLGVCAGMLADYGLSSKELRELTGSTVRPRRDVPTAQRLFRDIAQLSELLNEWADATDYVDESGRPAILEIEGTHRCFSRLVAKYFDSRPVGEVIDLGCKTRVLERVGPNKVAQLSACVVLTGNPTLVLAHAVYSVRSFLATTRHNAMAPAGGCILPDRKAATVLSAEDLPDFVAAMRQPTANLVEMGNRWLTRRAAEKKRTSPRKALIGIHVYVFQDKVGPANANP